MEIPGGRKKGLSQSTDILLLLTATLAVGGIMYGVATGLITGLGNVSSIQVSSANIKVGTGSDAFSITLKNSGNTVIKATSGTTASITISGLAAVAMTPTASGGDTHGDALAWACTATSATVTQTTCTSTASITLNPGDIISLSFYTGVSTSFTAGSTYTINGLVGSATFSTAVIASST